MVTRIKSYGILGIEAYPVDIEIDISSGLPKTTVIGLADTAIKESKERIKAAIKNSGFKWPGEKITISLAPSDIKKEGTGFDLAIALGILSAGGQIKNINLDNYCILGELSLDGTLRRTKGILPISISLSKSKVNNIILPLHNARESAIVSGIQVFPLQTLNQAIEFLSNPDIIKPLKLDLDELFKKNSCYNVNFSEIKGQYSVKRAIEVAVSGGHNILMIGPPGGGKTMIAKRIPTIMPELTLTEALEVTKIHSVAGNAPLRKGLISQRPFRAPHHTISYPALVGGGPIPRPGEISLAHSGVLFLDELPEFNRDCLETLRQPLEDGNICVSRVNKSFIFPASFMLVCAMNPCPCGALGELNTACRCSTTQIYKYRSKISGPLLDRIDIHIEVPSVRYHDLTSKIPGEDSSQIKERINKTRKIQQERFFHAKGKIICNANMGHKEVSEFCAIEEEEKNLLKLAMQELNFSARAYDKILKVARTIADMAGSENIKTDHLSEAIQYRSLDRNFF